MAKKLKELEPGDSIWGISIHNGFVSIDEYTVRKKLQKCSMTERLGMLIERKETGKKIYSHFALESKNSSRAMDVDSISYDTGRLIVLTDKQRAYTEYRSTVRKQCKHNAQMISIKKREIKTLQESNRKMREIAKENKEQDL